MKKITKREYSDAVAVVKKYHTQIDAVISQVDKLSEITLREFVRNVELTTRLRNALNCFIQESKSEREIMLDELDKSTFRKLRYVGHLSWLEFSSKRDKYMQERELS